MEMGIKNAWKKSPVFTPVAKYIYSPENPDLNTLQDSIGWRWHFEEISLDKFFLYRSQH